MEQFARFLISANNVNTFKTDQISSGPTKNWFLIIWVV